MADHPANGSQFHWVREIDPSGMINPKGGPKVAQDFVSKELFEERSKRLEDKIESKAETLRANIRSDIQTLLQPIVTTLAVLDDRTSSQRAWNIAIVGAVIAGVIIHLMTR